MARVFTDGAEFGDLLFWNSTSLVSVATAQKRTGSYSYQISNQGGSGSATKSISAISEFYLRLGFYFLGVQGGANDGRIVSWRAGSTVLGTMRINASSKKIELYVDTTLVDTGDIALTNGAWYVLELHVQIGDAGVLEVKIDNTADASYSGDTKPGADATVDSLLFHGTDNGFASYYFYYDDLALNDTTGGADNSWCGDGRVIVLMPTGNGDVSQLDGSDGNQTDNYALVDERPHNSDTDYVESADVGDRDLYTLADTGLVGVTINRVWGEARARDTASGSNPIAFVVKTGGTEYDSADVALPGSYGRVVSPDWKLNPDTSAPWTPSELDAAQFGPKVV